MSKVAYTHLKNGTKIREEGMKTCPCCGEKKPMEDFGFRNMGDGTIRPQSWCKCDRSKKE